MLRLFPRLRQILQRERRSCYLRDCLIQGSPPLCGSLGTWNMPVWMEMYCECNSHPGFWRLSTHPTPPPKKVNWYSLYKEQHGGSLKKKRNLKSEFPYDPAIPLLGICPEKSLIWKDTRTLMFIAAWYTAAKMWKQPKCPSTDERITMWCTYTME